MLMSRFQKFNNVQIWCMNINFMDREHFMIERRRWGRNKIERQQRKCEVCDSIEDEYHCLIECVRFTNERKGCLSAVLKKKEKYV